MADGGDGLVQPDESAVPMANFDNNPREHNQKPCPVNDKSQDITAPREGRYPPTGKPHNACECDTKANDEPSHSFGAFEPSIGFLHLRSRIDLR